MVQMLTPAYRMLVLGGGEQGAKRISQAINRGKSYDPYRLGFRASNGSGWYTRKDFHRRPEFSFAFDLFNPWVLTAVDDAVMAFCRSTLETALGDLADPISEFRRQLAEGVEAGEATISLNRRALEVFNDPFRAARVAQTEASRAVHLGQVLAAKESGVVAGKRWLASPDACDLCLSLNGKVVGLDEPFHVFPKGGPYAMVYHPPAHPHCFCSLLDELMDNDQISAAVLPFSGRRPGYGVGRAVATSPGGFRMAASYRTR